MNQPSDHDLPPELREVAERLRAERHTGTGQELDRVQVRVRLQASEADRWSTRNGAFLKSRIAITAILAIGLLMSGTGATLAVVGVSSSGSSGIAQYGEPGSGLQGQGGGGDAPGSGLEGQGGGGDAPGSGLEGQGGGGNLDDGVGGDGVGDGSAGASSPGDQVGATDGEELPFSGFLAIPLLILGVGLVAGGAILRRRTA